jgi:hypothetical protein
MACFSDLVWLDIFTANNGFGKQNKNTRFLWREAKQMLKQRELSQIEQDRVVEEFFVRTGAV